MQISEFKCTMPEKIVNQNSQPESKRTEKIDLPPLTGKIK
jgi:hypothetical protein